jgi:hypothetical protein
MRFASKQNAQSTKNEEPKKSKTRANATPHFEITQALRKQAPIFAKS